MADDPRYRPPRSDRYPSDRGFAGSQAAPAADPLAELVRLIGQDDARRDGDRGRSRAADPPQADELPPAPSWLARANTTARDAGGDIRGARQSPRDGGTQRDRYADLESAVRRAPIAPASPVAPAEAGYDDSPAIRSRDTGFQESRLINPAPPSAPVADDGDPYSMAPYDGRYADGPQIASDVEGGAYDRDDAHLPPHGDVTYRDAPLSVRRGGLVVVAALVALAVLGTAGAFGYRAWSGGGGPVSPGKVPIIKASTEPSKVMASREGGDASQGKLITDRVDKGQGALEQVVPRDEEPVSITTKPQSPHALGTTTGSFAPASSNQAPLTGGTPTAAEPRKVRTIAIRPDQRVGAELGIAQPQPDQAPNIHTVNIAPMVPLSMPQALPPPPPEAPAPTAAPGPAPAQPHAPPQARRPAPQPANGPLAIAPQSQPADAVAPMRTAALPAASEAGHYVVQVSAQRNEAEAEASFRSLQAKYPSVLAGRKAMINRADKGEKGIFYRAQIGPFTTMADANQLCNNLKAAGGQCFVYPLHN